MSTASFNGLKRPTYRVPIGMPGNQRDVHIALKNVEAEVAYAEGRCLKDREGMELPSVVHGLLIDAAQQELLDAVRAMRALFLIYLPLQEYAWPSVVRRPWDAKRLERVFQTAIAAIAPSAHASVITCTERTTDVDDTDRWPADRASRLVCLWSSLLNLAAECALIQVPRQKPKKEIPLAS